MKKILLILTLFACILLTGCSTNFNKTEYKNITDIKNYQKYDVKVLEFKIRTQGKTYETSDVYIRVAFLTLEELNEFKTTPLETVNNLDDYPMEFIIFDRFIIGFEKLEECERNFVMSPIPPKAVGAIVPLCIPI